MRKAIISVPVGEENPTDLFFDMHTKLYIAPNSSRARIRSIFPENNPERAEMVRFCNYWLVGRDDSPADIPIVARDIFPIYTLRRFNSYLSQDVFVCCEMIMMHKPRLRFYLFYAEEPLELNYLEFYAGPVVRKIDLEGADITHYYRGVESGATPPELMNDMLPDARLLEPYYHNRHFDTLFYLLGGKRLQGESHNYYPLCESIRTLSNIIHQDIDGDRYILDVPLYDPRGVLHGHIIRSKVHILCARDTYYELMMVLIDNGSSKREYVSDADIVKASEELWGAAILFNSMFSSIPRMTLYVLDLCGVVRRIRIPTPGTYSDEQEYTTVLDGDIACKPDVEGRITKRAEEKKTFSMFDVYGEEARVTRYNSGSFVKYAYIRFNAIAPDSLPTPPFDTNTYSPSSPMYSPDSPPSTQPLYQRTVNDIKRHFDLENYGDYVTDDDPFFPYRNELLYERALSSTKQEYREIEEPEECERLRVIVDDTVREVSATMYQSVYTRVLHALRSILDEEGFPLGAGADAGDGKADLFNIISRYLNVYLNGMVSKAFEFPEQHGRVVPFERLSQRAFMCQLALIAYVDGCTNICKAFKDRFDEKLPPG